MSLRQRWLLLIGIGVAVVLLMYFGRSPDLSKLEQARSIYIENDWAGLYISRQAHYDLMRQDDAFAGKANYSTVGRTTVEEVNIPLSVAQDFLSSLAQSPAIYGDYHPQIEYTDDYPSIVVEIRTEDETVRFYSKSQGEDHVPWGLDQLGSSYSINSNQPAKALALLKPYLKEDVLDSLVNRPSGTPDSRP